NKLPIWIQMGPSVLAIPAFIFREWVGCGALNAGLLLERGGDRKRGEVLRWGSRRLWGFVDWWRPPEALPGEAARASKWRSVGPDCAGAMRQSVFQSRWLAGVRLVLSDARRPRPHCAPGGSNPARYR